MKPTAFVAGVRAPSQGNEFAAMRFWYYFWTINFIVAGSVFGLITVVVLVRGSQDLRSMFARLKETRQTPEPNPPASRPKL